MTLSVKLLFAASILTGFATGCDNKQNLPKCDSSAVKNQLLQVTASATNKNQFVIPAISSITTDKAKSHNQLLNCKTEITYQHQIYPLQKITQKYSYQVNTEYQITQVQSTKKDSEKFKKWLDGLPTVVSQQQTHSGILAVIQTRRVNKNNDLIQLLIKDSRVIKLNNRSDYSSITIDKRFIFGNQEIYLISAYYNDATDKIILHNFFLALESSSLIVSKPFAYLPGSIRIEKPDILLFNGLYKYPFAETGDTPVYKFQANKISLLSDSKPLSYYQQKFAVYTPTRIMKQIKNDGCLNGDQFYLSDICSAKISTYCFEFHAMRRPEQNKTFWLLKNMCQIQQY